MRWQTSPQKVFDNYNWVDYQWQIRNQRIHPRMNPGVMHRKPLRGSLFCHFLILPNENWVVVRKAIEPFLLAGRERIIFFYRSVVIINENNFIP